MRFFLFFFSKITPPPPPPPPFAHVCLGINEKTRKIPISNFPAFAYSKKVAPQLVWRLQVEQICCSFVRLKVRIDFTKWGENGAEWKKPFINLCKQ
jgi:hypothetical protein